MRFEQWPELMAEAIEGARKRPFSWGSHDCCAFAARVVTAMTGRDFMADFGAYQSETEAAALLAANGGVRGIAAACLGAPIPPLCAQRGDVVVIDTEAGEALAICDGALVISAAPRGVTLFKLDRALAAWRVG